MLMVDALRAWPRRRWIAAVLATAASLLLLGLPTAMIPNPVFARPIDAPVWTYPSLVVTSVLAGLLLATYVRSERRTEQSALDDPTAEEFRSFTVGGALAFFAIGCPTCNKLVLIALGTSGALQWFEPVQPILSVAGIGVLVWALRRRLAGELVCPVPARHASRAE